MSTSLAHLETLLRSLGAMPGSTWAAVVDAAREARYGADRAVYLEAGGLLYVGEGLLKQYTLSGRNRPSINRFIQQGGTYAIPHNHDTIYVKALQPSTLYLWDAHTLRRLLAEHVGLLSIYMKLRDRQEEQLDTRLWLLEQRGREKLQYFDKRFAGLRAHIRGKDLANYLHLAYAYISQLKG